MKRIMLQMLLAVVLGLFGCGGGTGNSDNPSSAKAITSFTFESPAATGEIDETNHTISITVPNDTAVTALEPTIAHTGESISPESGVTQDFSIPVTYTVTARDGSTQDYLVSLAYKADQTSKVDQTSFSAGGDQNKLTSDPDFTQAATGVEGTGATTYVRHRGQRHRGQVSTFDNFIVFSIFRILFFSCLSCSILFPNLLKT